jgi:mRNA interferase RelE/StbE
MRQSRSVEYLPAAVKMLTRIDQATSRRIVAKVKQLADDPTSLARNITAIKGGEGLSRLRVGDWRVIYTETLVVLTVQRVAPRGGAYD